MLHTLEEKVDPKHAALVVVDVQNDFCHEDSPYGKAGRDMAPVQAAVSRLLELIEAARAAGTLVIFVQVIHSAANDSDVWKEQKLRARGHLDPVCEEGSWGAEFYRVAPKPGEPVVTKHRYSAFTGTDLDMILRTRGIKSLIMTGISTNACVESTARDGFMHDYYIVFVSDCTAALGGLERHEATLANIRDLFGIVVTAEEIMNVWRRAAVEAVGSAAR